MSAPAAARATGSPVTVAHRDGVATLTIDNPPVNALAHAVLEPLLAAIEAADADPSIRAILILGAGKHFVAGADIREFDAAPKAPLLNDVLTRLEGCAKPVIAALHGQVLGGGLELALACHYRAATRDAKLGFPEINLGLLPGAGGTQRMPRLIGAPVALEMMLSGESLGFERARELGIVDAELPGVDAEAALAYVRELLAANAPVRRLSERAVPATDFATGSQAIVARMPAKHRALGAVPAIVSSVAASFDKPFAEGMALARRSFEELLASPQSRALRHLFFAERDASRRGTEAAPRAVEEIAVIGAGTMGSGIAISLLLAGYRVVLVDSSVPGLAKGVERIRTTLAQSAQKGRITAVAADEAVARLRSDGELDAAAPADLVIEAVFEDMNIKREIFGQLDALCRPGAILATNTSTLNIDRIASAVRRPRDVIGMHFFSPANIMRLVEIVRGDATAPDVIATAQAVTRRVAKIGVLVGNCFGFVGNRMLYAYGRENQLMLLEGATPAQIDDALQAFGMAMGPNAVGDLAGLDIGYQVRRARTDLPADPRFYRASDLLVEAGRLGQKTGKGAYRYDPRTRERIEDPQVHAMLRAEGERLGIRQREVGAEEIVARCIHALINEGAKILGERIAASAADIDVIWCNGYGFPRHRGGPMFHATLLGLDNVLHTVRQFQASMGSEYWAPAPLLMERVQAGSNAWSDV
jgi:3-hydroxyacyl-CoA dehydrogenase